MHAFEITDRFNTYGNHTIEWYFHLDAQLRSKKEDNSIIIFKSGKSILKLDMEISNIIIESNIQNGMISKTYNKREPAQIIYYKFEGEVTPNSSFVFQLSPFESS